MDSSCLVLESLMRESSLLNEEQRLIMLEDARILNEGLGDFLNSIKDMAKDRLESLVKRKYAQIEDAQKKNESILTRNKVNVAKIKSTIEGAISSNRTQLKAAAEKGDKNLFQRVIAAIVKKIKEFFEKNPNIFGWRTADPMEILVPLAITIVVITLKALAIFLAIWVGGPLLVGGGLGMIAQILLIFVAVPLIEEAGKFFAIKTDSGGKYMVMFNAADFALTMFALPGALLIKIIMRIISGVSHAATYVMQKRGEAQGEHELAFRNAFMLNMIRNLFEVVFGVLSKAAG